MDVPLLRLPAPCFALVCTFLPLPFKCSTVSAVCHKLRDALLAPHCFCGDHWQLTRESPLPPPQQLPRFRSLGSLSVEKDRAAVALQAVRQLLLTCASSLHRLSLFVVAVDEEDARSELAWQLQLLVSCAAPFTRLRRLELRCLWYGDVSWLQQLQAVALPGLLELSIGQPDQMYGGECALPAAPQLPTCGRAPAVAASSAAGMAGLCILLSQHSQLQSLDVAMPVTWSADALQAVLELPSLQSWRAVNVRADALSVAIDAVSATRRLPLLPALDSLQLGVVVDEPLHRRDGLLAVSRLLDQLQAIRSLALATAGWEHRLSGETQPMAEELPASVAQSLLSACGRGLRRLALDQLLSLLLLRPCSHRRRPAQLESLCLVLQDYSADQQDGLAALLGGCSERLTAISVSLCGQDCFRSAVAAIACIAAHCPSTQQLSISASEMPLYLVVKPGIRAAIPTHPVILPSCLDVADVQQVAASSGGAGSRPSFQHLHTLSVYFLSARSSPATPEAWHALLYSPWLPHAPLTTVMAPTLQRKQIEARRGSPSCCCLRWL